MSDLAFYFLGGTCGSFVKKLFAHYLIGIGLPTINKDTGDSHFGHHGINHYHFLDLIPDGKKIIAIRYDKDDIDLIIKMEYEKATKPWLEQNWIDAQKEYDELLPYKSVYDMPYEVWYNIYRSRVATWVENQDWNSFELVIELKTILGLNSIDLNKQISDYLGVKLKPEVDEKIIEYRTIQEKMYKSYYDKPKKVIYTIGDSFTYGEELEDRNNAWPSLLANKFDMSLINEGKPGVGNEYIIKRTILAVSKHRPDLVIIGWTSCARQEHADDLGVYDIWPGCSSKKFENNQYQNRKDFIKYITANNNDMHEYRRWLRQVVLLQSFLQNHNIDYIMCNTFDNQHRFGKYYTLCQDYYDLIDDSKFVGWPNDGMVEWAYGTPHGPGRHPLELGHQRIADKIAEYI